MLSCAVYVIFGATGGIGQDLAKRLLAANNKVVLAAHDNDKLSKLKEELGGGETKAVDVMNSKQVCLNSQRCTLCLYASVAQAVCSLKFDSTCDKASFYVAFSKEFLHDTCRSLTF